MSVFRFQGALGKRPGIGQFIAEQVKLIDLRPVTRVSYKFDPFREDAAEFRNVMFWLSISKVRLTNYKCTFKTDIVCDRSEPEVIFQLENGTKLRFETANLTTLEIYEHLNKILIPLLPPPEELSTAPVVPDPKAKTSKKRK